MMNVNRLPAVYFRWMIRLACGVYILYYLANVLAGAMLDIKDGLQLEMPMVWSCIFVFLTSLIFMVGWKMIKMHAPDSETAFLNAASGFRMLMALATLAVYYAVFGSEFMKPMIIVFMVVYFLQLGLHSLFFFKYLK